MQDESESWVTELGLRGRKRPDGTPYALFKYLPPSRISVLTDNEVRFTQLNVFNDSFEGRPYFRNLPRQPMGRWGATDVWADTDLFSFPAYMETCVQACDEMSPRPRGDTLRQFLLSGICSVVGVFSLSEVPVSPLMWGHYADSHRGFVVGFDTDVPFFHCGNLSDAPNDDRFYPVRYTQSRPSRRSYRDVTAQDAFFTKSSDWAYEKEWRRYKLIRDADRQIDVDDDAIALFNFPRNALRWVILGMDTSETQLRLLQRALLLPVDYRNEVAVFQCYMNLRSYKLHLVEISLR
jgi:hypothetical protein